ncbi:MAG: SBBP repeat-containing protein [Myxococcales bacterium]|nr:SBBP repeat-containing protein [Myxococcales bacterium]
MRRRLRAAPAAATSAMPTSEGPVSKASQLPSPIAPMPDRSGRFVMRRPNSSTFFTQRGFAWSLSAPATTEPRDPRSPREQARKGWGVHCTLVGARDGALVAEQASAGRVHHFVGASSAWAPDQPTYGRLVWEELYPGIDLVTEPAPRGISYRFVLSPGAKIADVRMHWEGATAVRVVDEGRGVDVETGLGVLRVRGLRAYAIHNGSADRRTELPARHFVSATHEVGVVVEGWDGLTPLLIDPTVAWASYLGGSATESWGGIAVDTSGNTFVVGSTGSADFPTSGGFDTTLGGYDAFVTKVDGSGALVWSSYLGGASSDSGFAIAVDGGGNAFVTGLTSSADFPSSGGFDTNLGGGQDAFVTKVSSTGTLLWSSFLGGAGADNGRGIAVDATGNAFVTGTTGSADFPTGGGFDTTVSGNDAFVTKVSGTGALLWSSYLGGSNFESGTAIAVDGSGNAFVTGYTGSTNFPSTGGFDTTSGGGGYDDAFVTKISGAGALLWSSYLGGSSQDYAGGIAIDSGGNAFVVGSTTSLDFPSTGGFDTTFGAGDAFVTKVSGAGALLWSSYLGGSSIEEGRAVAVDAAGNAFVTGQTKSLDFPTSGGFDTTLGGSDDAFVTKISGAGVLLWSSYLGGSNYEEGRGIAVDGDGNALLHGLTSSTDFPASGVFDGTFGGVQDGFVAKVSLRALGASCAKASDCVSSLCVDSVCCDKACTGTCEACTAAKRGTGSDGTCGLVLDGRDPDAECTPASCAAGVATKAHLCNGAGSCRADGTVACGLYACAGSACATTCSSDAACTGAAHCSGTTCVADLDLGATCSRNDQCKTAFCADGVCCDKACGGACEACTAAKKGKGSDGACEPVAAGSDPKDACVADSGFPTSCKADGLCDGAGACRVYAPSGTACGDSTCASGIASGKTCNGAGGCDATPKSCGDYTCADDKVCRTTCTADADCAATAFCTTTGTCAPKGVTGATCGASKECASTFCVDGVCCDTACDGQCQACDVAGAAGTCTTVSGKPHGEKRPACADDGNGCAGTCDGKSAIACAYPDGKTVCGAGCSGSKIALCDGKGACNAPAACPDSLLCATDKACKAKCATSDDCVKGMTCDPTTGACTPARPTCSADLSASVSPEGVPTSCVQYLCDRSVGTCHKSCTSTEQCALGFACAGDHCEPQAAGVTEDSGCGVGPGGLPRAPQAFAVALATLALLARRRRDP